MNDLQKFSHSTMESASPESMSAVLFGHTGGAASPFARVGAFSSHNSSRRFFDDVDDSDHEYPEDPDCEAYNCS